MEERSTLPRHSSDPELIRACQQGQQAAWNELVDRYGRLVYSIARRYGLGESDADDVVQVVFTTVFRRLEQLRDQTRLSAWLITTTHRECWRVRRRSREYTSMDQIESAAPDPDLVEQLERQHIVRQALEELGGKCRELLTALFLEPGQPAYERIAEKLDMKVGSIGPTRARCFEKLQPILARLGYRPDEASMEVGDRDRDEIRR
jgi:RNA polymerase sigma factor (sigma-70 family)